MEPLQYQGLFYLSSGIGTFTTLLLGLRALSSNAKAAAPANAADNDGGWHHKEALPIVDIVAETHDIKTFRFKRGGSKPFPLFAPGQFLSFQIGDNEKCLRSYSISGSTANRETLQVSIKRLNNGQGSGWFHERKVGDKVWVFPPNGLFTDKDLAQEQRIYIAGGIGITPMLSMITTNIDCARNCEMVLFYAARSPKDIAFHELLVYLAKRYPHFKYFPVVSATDESWSGLVGHVSYSLIKEKVQLAPNARYFFCGPPPMTAAISEELLKNGVPEDAIHSEKFASPQAFDPAKIPHREAAVTYLGQRYDYKGKQTLLEFLEAQGCGPAFACRVGVCGTCKVHVKGKVEALTDAGLTLAEKRKGMTLTCVAFPLENIELQDEG